MPTNQPEPPPQVPSGPGGGPPLKLPRVALIPLLIAVGALAPISIDMFLPSLPEIGRVFNADPALLQLSVSGFVLAFAISQLLYGPLSDRFGRRGPLVGGMALYTLAGVGCIFASSAENLIAVRVLQGLAASGGSVLARAIVRDLYAPDRAAKVLAYVSMSIGLAPILAPIIGGYLQVTWGWRGAFVTLAIMGLAFTVLVALFLPETNRHRDPHAMAPRAMLANYRTLLRSRLYVGYALTMMLMFSGNFVFIAGSPFVLIELLGLPPDLFGYSFGMVAFGFMSGSFLASRVVGRLALKQVILLGNLISCGAVTLLLALAFGGAMDGPGGAWWLVGVMYLVTVGVGMTLPTGMGGAIGPFPRMAGLASAVVGFIQMGGAPLYVSAVSGVQALLGVGGLRPFVVGIAVADYLALLVIVLVLLPAGPPAQGGRG